MFYKVFHLSNPSTFIPNIIIMVDEYPSPWIDWIRNYIDLLNQFRLDDCNLMRLNHLGFNFFFWHKKKMKPQLHFRSDPSWQFKTGYVGNGFLMLKQRMLVAVACPGHFASGVPTPTLPQLPALPQVRCITNFASTERFFFSYSIEQALNLESHRLQWNDFMANQCQSLTSLTY
ncbi:hypothetical protein ACFX2I_036919 [Malus domestica]|nr:uncharacterized protein LOC103427791 [Malus domestica]